MAMSDVLDAFDAALTAQERAGESRKAITAAQKLIDKVVDAVTDLPDEFGEVITIDADLLAKMAQATAPAADLAPAAKKLVAVLEIAEDVPGMTGELVEKATDLLTRYRALKPTTGVRDGSSKVGSRALPGLIRLTFPDGKVRNSNGDWTSIRWEARDHADKRNTEIAKAELDNVFQNLKVAVASEIGGEWTVEDELGNEYLIEYLP